MTIDRSRAAALVGARAVLLAGATVLAFFSGGYFDGPRVWAGLIASVLVLIAVLASPRSLPRTPSSWLAIGGLALFALWTLISFTWAPIAGNAYHAGQRVVLYAAILLAAAMLLQDLRSYGVVEPALAAGALIVIGYGVSERLLPGILHFARSVSAQGRLEQPLTYWNTMGELAAIGLLLCARIAGDRARGERLRIAATAAAAPLGMGLYLSFSRGALFACAAGIVALLMLDPRREQLGGLLACLAAAALAAVAAAPFKGVTSLAGTLATRERQGAIALAALVVIMFATGAAMRRLARSSFGGEIKLPRRAPWMALGLICAGLALAIVIGAKERSTQPLSASANRFVTLQSNRYAYWRVAFRAFRDEPIRGVGAGGWSVYWLRYRPFDEFAQDAHSLPLQTMAELGLIGLALLAAFLAGVTLAAARALRAGAGAGAGAGSGAGLAAGPIAAFVVYLAHAPLDWDWQMPAVTIIALVCAGALLARSEAAGFTAR